MLFPKTTNMTFSTNSCSTTNTDPDGNPIPCYICKEKCRFSYTDVTFKAICKGETGIIQYSEVTVQNSLNHSPIILNEDSFGINDIILYAPSIGKYGVDDYCELVIKTNSTYGNLNIFIPILVTDSDGILKDIQVLGTPYNEYFKLSDYIPQMPYIFYNTTTANYIVFPVSSLTISKTLRDTICSSSTNPKVPAPQYYTGPLYYNQTGPGDSPDDTNEIYINCSPTDHSNVATTVPRDPSDIKPYKPPTSILDKVWLFYLLVGIIIFVVCYIVVTGIIKLIEYITPKDIKSTFKDSKTPKGEETYELTDHGESAKTEKMPRSSVFDVDEMSKKIGAEKL